MAFKYQARSKEALDKRATQQGGDFQGFLLDEFRTYTPRKGDNWIRLLPPTFEDPQHYGMDVWVHYGIGPDRASAICINKQPHPTEGTTGPCPICEARMRAERAGDDELAGELKASKRVLVWMLDRREEEKGALLWAMPWTLDRDICKISKDKRSGEVFLIDHPDDGYDVTFDREGDGMQVKYTGIQLARRPSSVDEEILEYIQGAPLPYTLRWRNYDELKEMFEGSGMEQSGGGRRETRDRGGDRGGRQDDRRGDDRRESRQDDRRDARPAEQEERRPPQRATLARPKQDEPPFDPDPPRTQRTQLQRELNDEIPEHPPKRAEVEREPPPRSPPPREAASSGGSSAAERAAALRARFAQR